MLDVALAWSVINSHLDVADFLLQHGADINTTWSSHEPASILHELVWHRNYEAMQFLIDRGIDMTTKITAGIVLRRVGRVTLQMTKRWPSGWKKPNSSRSGEYSAQPASSSHDGKSQSLLTSHGRIASLKALALTQQGPERHLFVPPNQVYVNEVANLLLAPAVYLFLLPARAISPSAREPRQQRYSWPPANSE